MTKRVGVAAEDQEMLTFVATVAEKLDAVALPALPAREAGFWAREYDALIYDEDQVGGDTAGILGSGEPPSLLVSRAELQEDDRHGLERRVEEFLTRVL